MDAPDTLESLFPGNIGKLRIARLILFLGMPELAGMDRSAPLTPAVAERLKQGALELDRAMGRAR